MSRVRINFISGKFNGNLVYLYMTILFNKNIQKTWLGVENLMVLIKNLGYVIYDGNSYFVGSNNAKDAIISFAIFILPTSKLESVTQTT